MSDEADPFYATLDVPKLDGVCPVAGSVCMQLGCYLCSGLIGQAEHGELNDANLRRFIIDSIRMAHDPVGPCPYADAVDAVADQVAQHRNLNP